LYNIDGLLHDLKGEYISRRANGRFNSEKISVVEKPAVSKFGGRGRLLYHIIYDDIIYHGIHALRRGDSRGGGGPTESFWAAAFANRDSRPNGLQCVARVPVVRSYRARRLRRYRRHRVFGVMSPPPRSPSPPDNNLLLLLIIL